MFLKNNPILFDLTSVPLLIKETWESSHGRHSLENLREIARKVSVIRIAGALLTFCLSVISVIHSSKSSSLSHPWLLAVGTGVLFSGGYLLFAAMFMPPINHELYKQFIREYHKLMKLLNQEWKYGFVYPTGGPGAQPTFESLETFVRKRLENMAKEIHDLEAIKFKWNEVDVFGVKEKAKALRAEFGRIYDILKPFGLVYPSYEPYFNPDGAYLFD